MSSSLNQQHDHSASAAEGTTTSHSADDSSSSSTETVCNACGFESSFVPEGMMKCQRCQAVSYCSLHCLQWDWKSGGHANVCVDIRPQAADDDDDDISSEVSGSHADNNNQHDDEEVTLVSMDVAHVFGLESISNTTSHHTAIGTHSVASSLHSGSTTPPTSNASASHGSSVISYDKKKKAATSTATTTTTSSSSSDSKKSGPDLGAFFETQKKAAQPKQATAKTKPPKQDQPAAATAAVVSNDQEEDQDNNSSSNGTSESIDLSMIDESSTVEDMLKSIIEEECSVSEEPELEGSWRSRVALDGSKRDLETAMAAVLAAAATNATATATSATMTTATTATSATLTDMVDITEEEEGEYTESEYVEETVHDDDDEEEEEVLDDIAEEEAYESPPSVSTEQEQQDGEENNDGSMQAAAQTTSPNTLQSTGKRSLSSSSRSLNNAPSTATTTTASQGQENNGSTSSSLNNSSLQQKGNKRKSVSPTTSAASLKAFRNIYEEPSPDLHASGSLALKEFRQAYQNGDGSCGQATTTSESSLSLSRNNGQHQEKALTKSINKALRDYEKLYGPEAAKTAMLHLMQGLSSQETEGHPKTSQALNKNGLDEQQPQNGETPGMFDTVKADQVPIITNDPMIVAAAFLSSENQNSVEENENSDEESPRTTIARTAPPDAGEADDSTFQDNSDNSDPNALTTPTSQAGVLQSVEASAAPSDVSGPRYLAYRSSLSKSVTKTHVSDSVLPPGDEEEPSDYSQGDEDDEQPSDYSQSQPTPLAATTMSFPAISGAAVGAVTADENEYDTSSLDARTSTPYFVTAEDSGSSTSRYLKYRSSLAKSGSPGSQSEQGSARGVQEDDNPVSWSGSTPPSEENKDREVESSSQSNPVQATVPAATAISSAAVVGAMAAPNESETPLAAPMPTPSSVSDGGLDSSASRYLKYRSSLAKNGSPGSQSTEGSARGVHEEDEIVSRSDSASQPEGKPIPDDESSSQASPVAAAAAGAAVTTAAVVGAVAAQNDSETALAASMQTPSSVSGESLDSSTSRYLKYRSSLAKNGSPESQSEEGSAREIEENQESDGEGPSSPGTPLFALSSAGAVTAGAAAAIGARMANPSGEPQAASFDTPSSEVGSQSNTAVPRYQTYRSSLARSVRTEGNSHTPPAVECSGEDEKQKSMVEPFLTAACVAGAATEAGLVTPHDRTEHTYPAESQMSASVTDQGPSSSEPTPRYLSYRSSMAQRISARSLARGDRVESALPKHRITDMEESGSDSSSIPSEEEAEMADRLSSYLRKGAAGATGAGAAVLANIKVEPAPGEDLDIDLEAGVTSSSLAAQEGKAGVTAVSAPPDRLKSDNTLKIDNTLKRDTDDGEMEGEREPLEKGGTVSEGACRRGKLLKYGLCILVLVAIALGIGLGVGLQRDSSTRGAVTTSTPTLSPSSKPAAQTLAPSVPSSMPAAVQVPSQVPTLITLSPTVSPTSTPTARPTFGGPTFPPATQELFDLISSVAFDGGASIKVDGTPQSRAFEWLASNESVETLTDERKIQRYSLGTFYFSTAGENWTNSEGWLTDTDECTWFSRSVSICDNSDAYVDLSLGFNGLGGTLPPEVALLSNLQKIAISGGAGSKIGGELPEEYGALQSLRSFSVRNNAIGGQIPSDIAAWTSLEFLDLSTNSFSGPFSPSFTQLTSLRELELTENEFEGELPDISTLSNLERLALVDNNFNGPLDGSIGLLSKLRNLKIERNAFTSIPNAIGLLTSLETLTAYENNVTGPLFAVMEGLNNLLILDVHSNSLSGSIPPEVSALQNLRYLDLSSNAFEGEIPDELANLTNLIDLQLQSNLLRGEFPASLSALSRLGLIRVDDNSLEGVVPDEVCATFSSTLPTFYLDCGGANPEIVCPPGPCCTYCCENTQDTSVCECLYEGTGFQFLC